MLTTGDELGTRLEGFEPTTLGSEAPYREYRRLPLATDDSPVIYSFRRLFSIIYRQMLWRVKRYVDKMLT